MRCWQQFPLTVVANMCQLHLFFLLFLYFFWGVCSIFGAAADRTSLALTQRESGRERDRKRSSRERIVAAFSSWLLSPAARQQHSGISREKQSPNNVTHTRILYVCMFVWLCVCMCVSHRHMPDSHQFLATIRPSKQPFIPSASQPCSYPFIHLSIYLSSYPAIHAAARPSRRASRRRRRRHVVGLNYNVSCHARIFALALYVGVKSLTCASIASCCT